MKIKNLYLENFRNLKPLSLELDSKVIILKGENAQGKTSFLEALYASVLSSSFKSRKLIDCINFDKEYFSSSVFVSLDSADHKISSYISKDKRKVTLDNKQVSDYSQLFSKFCMLLFSNDDKKIILAGPEERRKYINQVLSFSYESFLSTFKSYSFYFKSRNASLRVRDSSVLDSLDKEYAKFSYDIFSLRQEIAPEIESQVNTVLKEIFDIKGQFNIEYKSDFISKKINSPDEYYSFLQDQRKNELSLGHSSSGLQRDDFIFYLDSRNIKETLSTGQIRLFSIILKFAILKIISLKMQISPIILVDDALLELDLKKKIAVFEYLLQYKQIYYTFMDDEDFYNFCPSVFDKKELVVSKGEVSENS